MIIFPCYAKLFLMNNKINILVFPCGSEIGLDIYHALKYSRFFHLIGGSSVDDHGKFVFDDYIGNIPSIYDYNFISEIKKIVKEREIKLIYPSMDSVIAELMKHENDLGCKIVSSPLETTLISLSKELTYKTLDETVRIPKEYSLNDKDIPFPVFVKPIVGYGSRGTKLISNYDELLLYLSGKEDQYLILEYLPGNEYTVDCFTDRHGQLRYSAARRRNRIKNGISVNTSFVKDQRPFLDISSKINETLKFRGAWFYQVKEDSFGNLCLMEIASRIGGSSLLTSSIGVNLALLSVFDILDYDVEIQSNDYSVELDRALDAVYKTDLNFDTVYVDFDDCLILDDSLVNTELVSFLYKCINNKKSIILLSKHAGNLDEDLEHFRLHNIFDQIIHLKQDEDKCNFMTANRGIFIDDSFSERSHVHSIKGYPVFSPDMCSILNCSI